MQDLLQADIADDGISPLLQRTPQLLQFFTRSEDCFGHTSLVCKYCSHTLTSARCIVSHQCKYECKKCGTEKSSPPAIMQHQIICSRQSPAVLKRASLTCKFCSFHSTGPLELQQHKKEHINDCLKQYSAILKEQGLAETPAVESQPSLKRGRPRKMSECTKCNVLYGSQVDLHRHVKLNHRESLLHACRLCEDRFIHREQLEIHIVGHFLGSFSCDFCGIHFSYKYPFLKHLESNHSGNFLLKCEFCKFTTGSYNDYRQHRKENHKENFVEAASVCEECGELIPQDESEEHVDEHLSSREPLPVIMQAASNKKPEKHFQKRDRHGARKLHKCFECGLTFPSPAGLSRHNHDKHPYKYTKHCEICGHRFKGRRSLELHKEGHKSGNCWCPVCKLRFRHRLHVAHHFRKAHASVPYIQCEYCNTQVTSYSKYLYHCRSVHADLLEDRAELKCSQCDKFFSSHILINKHMAKEHGVNRQNALKTECPVCKKYFVHLDIHMNLHTRAVQFPCEECGEVFFLRSSLLAHHKLRHDENARAYTCETCSRGFISKSLLRTHHEQVHLHRRQFFCEICGRSYKNKSALTYHLKVHTGERPYICQECGAGFHRPSSLKIHMEGTHHLPYSYLYRKPQRRAGAGIGASIATETAVENAKQNVEGTCSNSADIDIPKSIVIGDRVEIKEVNIVKEISMVEEVAAGVKINMNDTEIITVV